MRGAIISFKLTPIRVVLKSFLTAEFSKSAQSQNNLYHAFAIFAVNGFQFINNHEEAKNKVSSEI